MHALNVESTLGSCKSTCSLACMHACVGSETGLRCLVAGLVLLIGCTAQEKAN